jgi:hypothetical protein
LNRFVTRNAVAEQEGFIMSKDGGDDVAKLGAAIGRRLSDAKTSAATPMVAMRMLVDAVLTEHPSVKLPELVGDAEVKQWLSERALGTGQLRQTLTEARRLLRDKPVVRRSARKLKGKPTDIPPPERRSAGELAANAVRTQSLADI